MNIARYVCIFKVGDLDDLLSFVAGEVKSMGCLDQQSGWRSVNYNYYCRFDLKISFQVSTSLFFRCFRPSTLIATLN